MSRGAEGLVNIPIFRLPRHGRFLMRWVFRCFLETLLTKRSCFSARADPLGLGFATPPVRSFVQPPLGLRMVVCKPPVSARGVY